MSTHSDDSLKPSALLLRLAVPLSSSILCGFIFNYVIQRFHLRWWMQYNYILAVSLDAGTAISIIMMFFMLTLPERGGIELNWWGNK